MAFTDAQRNKAIEAIRAKRDRLDRIESLIRDADTDDLNYLIDLIGSLSANGNGSANGAQAQTETVSAKQVGQGTGSKRKYNRRSSGKRANIAATVREAVEELQRNISVQTVREYMASHGVASNALRPAATIGTVFRKLESEGIIREVEPSSGRKPTIYEWVKA